MTASSPRSRCLNVGLALLLLGAGEAGAAERAHSSFEANYHIDFQSRLAYHTFGSEDLASHRHIFEAEEDLKLDSHWSAALGMWAYVEGAFASNSDRYNAPVRAIESQDIRPQDIYVQYRSGPVRLRLGNQQVPWGETFGTYYADIVNPKYMRDGGLGNLASQRIPIPMANALFFLGDSSVQLLYIPVPFFNKMPSLGNDFAIPFQDFFPGAQLSLNDNRGLPISTANGEAGIRLTTLFSGFDLALYYFNYHDRFPAYSMNVTNVSPLTIDLEGNHPRVQSVGFTGSKDLSPFVVRWESLYTQNRLYNTIENGLIDMHPSDEVLGVLGVDYDGLDSCKLGLQLSRIHRMLPLSGAFYPQNRDLVSLHANATLYRDLTAELIQSYSPGDGSELTQLHFTLPVSHQFDVTLGSDIFWGSQRSQFGMFRSASRAYVMVHGYFGG